METICLHHNDADGRASAAIVRRALGEHVLLLEMDYGDRVPWEQVSTAERVVVVDFSLPDEDMRRLADGRQLIWIDHHVSAIQRLSEIGAGWPGIRDTGQAACVLTWRYFFPERPVPKAVTLIGDRDTWQWKETETGPFDAGLHQEDTSPTNDALWQPLFDDDIGFISRLIETGKILREAQLKEIRHTVQRYGFPVTFQGYRTLAINARGSGDIGAYIQELGYAIAYCFVDNMQNGELTTFVGLYSAEVDVSEIARKFGGGGHRGASGFSFKRNNTPFPPEAEVQWE